MASFGMVGLDWQERINWDRMRKYRLERAREKMKAHGLGALLHVGVPHPHVPSRAREHVCPGASDQAGANDSYL